MSRGKKVIGYCKICNTHGPLTYEHTPPKSAFNERGQRYEIDFDAFIQLDRHGVIPDYKTAKSIVRGKILQKGRGAYSLCQSCNNNTGSWYASDFVKWSHQAMSIILRANGKPSLTYPTYFHPLRVIKQILVMFAANSTETSISDSAHGMDYFLLNKETRQIPTGVRVYAYYNIEGNERSISESFMAPGNGDFIHLSELSFPPFGFVLTFNNSPCPDKRLQDITGFSTFSYYKWIDYYTQFPVLPTYFPNIPADYRSKSEIEQAYIESKRFERENSRK